MKARPPKDTTGQNRAEQGSPRVAAPGGRLFNHELLRAIRLDLDLSQEEAAKTLGIDVRTYRRYESGEVNSRRAGGGGDFDIVRNTSRRQLLRKMCDELGVADESAWLVGPPDTPTAPSHALLRAQYFVGRKDIIEKLTVWAESSTPPYGVFAIVGVGGAGKTAIAERFATSSTTTKWVHSFYDDPRTERVVEELGRSSDNIVCVLDGLESVQAGGNITTSSSERAFGEIEEPALRRALRAVCAGIVKRKVLVTSRFPLTDLAGWAPSSFDQVILEPLSREDSFALLRAWGVRGDDAALSRVARHTGGHALSVAMTGSYASTFLEGDATHAIPETAEADDSSSRRLAAVLDSYAKALTERERDLLAHLSIFAGAADVTLLSEICQTRAQSELLPMIARLERLGLVAKTPQGVTAHPFVRDRFKRLLGADPRVAHATITKALESSLEGQPNANVNDDALLDRYEALLEHTAYSGRGVEAWGIYSRSLGGFGNLGLRLGAMSRGARVLAVLAACLPRLVPEHQADLSYDRGLYACALGDLKGAANHHDEHLAALNEMAAHPDVAIGARAMGRRTRAYVAWLAGDIDMAFTLLESSLDEATKMLALDERSANFHRVRARALEAIVAHDAGDDERATKAIVAVEAFETMPTARRAFWIAEILSARGEHDKARVLTERAIADCARRGWVGHVAHGDTVLGIIALQTNDTAKAREHLVAAKPWAEASNEVEMLLRCYILAHRLGEDADACTEGRALAETHGFRLLAKRF